MQEMHSTSAVENIWRSEWGWVGKIYYSHGASNARGTAILIKKKSAAVKVLKTITDQNGRYVILKCKIQGNIRSQPMYMSRSQIGRVYA